LQAPDVSTTNCAKLQHVTPIEQTADVLNNFVAEADTMETVQGVDSTLGTTKLGTFLKTIRDWI
jgi:hypothetical protein